MSLLKEIEDKGAVLEWSPVQGKPNLVALGTKDSSGIGFDDYGGGIELHSLDFADSKNTSSQLLGKAKSNSRFASLAWSQMASHQTEFPYGLIAGGMMDGFINVWDPAKFITDQPPLIASVEQHQGSIAGLHFNPHKESSHLLASGGNDGEVYVMSLERPDQPNVFIPAPPPNNAKHTADITKTVWNTQVAHIVGTSAQNGVCYVWDLRQKKAWCEIRDPTGGCVSDIAWNPDQGLHFITASGEDKNPVIKLWDLRSSTSVPLATLQGHTEGILSVSWCPFDTTFLLSCGKDNRTILWDLYHLQPVYDLPNDSSAIDHHKQPVGASMTSGGLSGTAVVGNTGFSNKASGGFDQSNGLLSPSKPNDLFAPTNVSSFGGLANTAGQKRYDIRWSPCLKSVVSTCSFDRKVHFFSLSGVQSKLKRAPKWLKKPIGNHFGFGGKLVCFDNSQLLGNEPNPSNIQAFLNSTKLSVRNIVEDHKLIESCNNFHQLIINSTETNVATAITANSNKKVIKNLNVKLLTDYCDMKAVASDLTSHDQKIWSLMKVICFSKNARAELLQYLGFKKDDITKLVEQYVKTKNPNFNGNLSNAPKSAHVQNPSTITDSNSDTDLAATATVASKTTAATVVVSPSKGIIAADTIDSLKSAESVFGSVSSMKDLSLHPRAGSPFHTNGISILASSINPVTQAEDSISATATALTTMSLAPEVLKPASKSTVTVPLTKEEIETEAMIRESIVIGNFAAAVELCLETDQMAEALILAQCGDQELWLKTQSIFFERSKNKHKFITILEAIIKNDLLNYVQTSDLSKWKETLAVCSTYGKADEYPIMCEKLGYRLQHESYDNNSAAVCYMCSSNINATISFWTNELKLLNATSIGNSNIHALQNYIEKVTIFSKANPDVQLSDDCLNYFAEYASLVAAQGRYEIALSYLKGANLQESILIDRLYTSAAAYGRVPQGLRQPNFPFERLTVNPVVAPTATVNTVSNTAQTAMTTTAANMGMKQNMPGQNMATAATVPSASVGGRIGSAIAGSSVGASVGLVNTGVKPVTTHTANTVTSTHRHTHPALQGLQAQTQVQAMTSAQTTPMAASTVAQQGQPQLAPGWQQAVDPSSGRPYYFNQATGQSAWDPPLAPAAAANVSTPTVAPVVASMSPYQQQQQPMLQSQQQSMQPAYTQSAASATGGGGIPGMYGSVTAQPTVFKPVGPSAMTGGMAPITSTGFNQPATTQQLQPMNPTPIPTPIPVMKELLPDTEGIILLNQVITSVTAAANPAEKRQMAMVNEAFNILRKRASEGGVAPDILQKVHQFANDICNRNFPSANAIQADLANTAWNDHKDWVKGLKVFIQIASKK